MAWRLEQGGIFFISQINYCFKRRYRNTAKTSLSSAINDYAIVKQEQDKYQESLILLKEAYKIAYKNFGSKDRDIASIANNLGLSFEGVKELDSAKIYYENSRNVFGIIWTKQTGSVNNL